MSVSRHFFRFVIVCGIPLSAVSFANEKTPASTELKAFPAYYESEQVFITAAKNAKLTIKPLTQRITGLTLPHHVPAVSMMAEALQLASTQRYSRIVIICPDHYARGSQLCSTTERDFLTASGRITSDRAAVRLLKKNADVADSNLFSHEHGILSILPLLHLRFPQTPVVAIALNARSNEADWQRMSAAIQPIIKDDTLLIQSTDFSHYLPWDQAKRRDQETLNQLCSGDPSRIATLIQPDHLDSKCCQWVQADLQKKCYRVKAPVVIDNRNVTQCGAPPNEPRTTSYITQLWCRDEVLAHQLPGEAWFFGGDVFFGRGVTRKYRDPAFAGALETRIKHFTNGSPLIINLEGVMFEKSPPQHAHELFLGMNATLAIEQCKRWGVHAAILENNHCDDFGARHKAYTIDMLQTHGIRGLHGESAHDLGRFRFACATDLLNQPNARSGVLTAEHIAAWREEKSTKPLIAWFHAGTEYQSEPDARAQLLAEWAERAGASLISGCHPHVSSTQWQYGASSLRWYSTGNMLFDQSHNDGTLLELRFFEQGTFTARIHHMGNLYHTKN